MKHEKGMYSHSRVNGNLVHSRDSRFRGNDIAVLSCFLLLASCLLLLPSCAKAPVSTASVTPAKAPYTGDNYKIGVILPLTGKYAIYGASTLNGIECAVGIFPPCEGPIKAELIIKDDAGDPLKAETAVEELVRNDHVSVIIGPLSSSSVEAAARKAQELSVPLISLSQREGITAAGDHIFSVALTATSQVNELVKTAVKTKGLKNLAIVYPMNPYGETNKQLFIEAVKNAGAKLAFAEGYGEATLDFGNIFRTKVKKFDAMFIPDSYRAVGYIGASLAAEGIQNIQLLGTNRWNNPELIERGRDTLQGAIFIDGFFEASKSPAVMKFNSMFKETYDIQPTILETLGFDAARLASHALRSTGGAHALDMRNSLATGPEVEGSVGMVGFDTNREALRRLFLLTVQGDDIVEM